MQKPLPYRSSWMTEELDDVSLIARTFFEREVVPNIERFAEQHEVDRETWLKAGAAGLLLISVPEEYGGGGGTFAHEAVVLQEQGWAGDDALGYHIHSAITPHYIVEYGTEEQKRAWLPKLASGEHVCAIAMTEPGTGSDLQAVKTTARRDGNDYVINGAKTFITNASHADIIIIVARTGDHGAKGISLIVAEVDDLPGFTRGRVLRKIGQHGNDTRELAFADMRVPVVNRLGEEGQGFYQLMHQLPQERLAVSVIAVAAAELAVRLATQYAKERKAFGKPIIEFQTMAHRLAECATDVLAARTFLDHCIGLHVDGKLDAVTASQIKYWSTDMQVSVIDRCLQVFGGYGYMMEYPIARMYAGARVQQIYAGTNEIMKELISRSL
ncbi:MAG: acyl-CoA dehydrogenase family protein [Tetrasphaera sp.]